MTLRVSGITASMSPLLIAVGLVLAVLAIAVVLRFAARMLPRRKALV